MGQNQINEYLEAMERAAEKYSVSKESARAALVEAGIVDRHGELTEHYRPPHVSNEIMNDALNGETA